MATSVLKIYKCEITPSRNCIVDNIETYLGSLTPTYESSDFSYVKISLNLTIKVNADQSKVGKAIGNYARIVNSDNSKPFYFFITGATWIAQSTVMLTLAMDTLNTFRNDFVFSDKTNIQREHENRFSDSSIPTDGWLHRKISKTDEGITPVKYVTDNLEVCDRYGYTSTLEKAYDQKWYLVYKSPENPSSDNPMECWLIPTKTFPIDYVASSSTKTLAITSEGDYYYLLKGDNGTGASVSFFSRGTKYTLVIGKKYNDSYGDVQDIEFGYTNYTAGGFPIRMWAKIQMTKSVLTISDIGRVTFNKSSYLRHSSVDISFTDAAVNTTRYAWFAGKAGRTYSATIDDVDRTDTRIAKIIECPYCPIDLKVDTKGVIKPVSSSWFTSLDRRCFALKPGSIGSPLSHSFSFSNSAALLPNYVGFPTRTVPSLRPFIHKSIAYESKLFNSSFYGYTLVYDSFTKAILMEYAPTRTSIYPKIEYKQSNAISSNLGFKIAFTDGSSTYEYKSPALYDNFLISTRSNESPVFSNTYLNYTRTGYSYDVKNAKESALASFINTGVTGLGTALGGYNKGTGGIGRLAAINWGMSALSQLSNAIIITVQNQRAIEQKQEEAKAQATAVSGNSDVDMLDWYSNNHLHIVISKPTDDVINKLWNLFFYTGYACNQQKVPDTNSRYWFNFVQCTPVFENEETTDVYNEYLDDIKTRFASGVTYYHDHNGKYDWNQEYENWETTLVHD